MFIWVLIFSALKFISVICYSCLNFSGSKWTFQRPTLLSVCLFIWIQRLHRMPKNRDLKFHMSNILRNRSQIATPFQLSSLSVIWVWSLGHCLLLTRNFKEINFLSRILCILTKHVVSIYFKSMSLYSPVSYLMLRAFHTALSHQL